MIAAEVEARTLLVSWAVSRGRETYGYNICRLDDTVTGKRYRCSGGGYDMTGTVFADWLEDVAQDELRKIADQAFYGPNYDRNESGLYGMRRTADGSVSLDGGCGLESMRRIAETIGYGVRSIVNRRGSVVGFTVTDRGQS